MGLRLAALSTVAIVTAARAACADDVETLLMRQVRLTTDATQTTGCAKLAAVSDDSLKDLRKKIVRAGGNTGLLTFGVADMSRVYAEVFRCVPTPSPPAGVPPPPPGAPPPPPPGPAR